MAQPVFLHYTQAELDRNFDQRGWAPNALEVIARYSERSKRTRALLEHRANVSYGRAPHEVLDIFPAAGGTRQVQIFVHGGAWRNFSKDDFSFPAEAFVAAGIHTVVINFTNLPAIRMPEMVAQVRRSIEWVVRNADSFDGDAQEIHLSAWSSGAQLAASALQAQPQALVRTAAFVSGPFYLEPVVLSARSSYLKLEPSEVRQFSPGLHAPLMPCPVFLGYAERDTDEFQRQTRAFATALKKAGKLSRVVRYPGLNHFELMERFADGSHALIRDILGQMNRSSA